MIVAPTTSAAGMCGTCSSLLAPGQRYCIVCGERRGELPFRVPERAEPMAPSARRSFGTAAAVVLGCGVLIGATVGPAITPASLASTAGQLIVVATGGSPRTSAPAAPQPTSLAAVPALSAPTGDVAKPPPVVMNRGGGGSTAPAQPAPVPAAPAPQAPAKAAPPPAAPPTVAPDPDPTVTGIVVHLSPDGKRYAMATKDGQLLVLHADKPPTLGDNLKVTVHALDDGTFDEKAANSLGTATTASFGGIVTFADPATGTYTVSARGVSMLVHLLPPQQLPAVGVQATIDATVGPQILETKRIDGDPVLGEFDLTAIVRDPGPNADPSKLVVSADDAGESPATLTLTIPPKLDVPKLNEPDTVIAAVVKRGADGSLTLVSATALLAREPARKAG